MLRKSLCFIVFILISSVCFGEVIYNKDGQFFQSTVWCDTHNCPGYKEQRPKGKKPFEGKSWANYKSTDHYTGAIDRKVLVSGMTPEQASNPMDTSKVLISTPNIKKEVVEEVKSDVIEVKKIVKNDVDVVGTIWLEDTDEPSYRSPAKECKTIGNQIICDNL